MKKLNLVCRRWVASLVIGAALAVAPITAVVGTVAVSTGCASLSRTTYKTVGTAQVTVEVALAAYNDFAKAGKTTPQQNLAVKKAFEQYQLASVAVIDAARAAQRAQTDSTNAPTSNAALNTALAAASASLSDLIALIQSFGVKIH